MKNFMRIFALILTVSLLLCGCSSEPEEFTCDELTMMVPGGMKDVSGGDAFKGFTFTLDSSKLAIFGLKESFADYDGISGLSLKDYAETVIMVNGLNATPMTRAGKDYMYFRYDTTIDGTSYSYLAATFKTDEAFWLVQLSSPTAKYDENAMFECLDSVRFN